MSSEVPRDVLGAFADYLRVERPHILDGWRRCVDADPTITTVSTLARAQFVDHIPQVLDALEQQLRARRVADREQAAAEQRERAAEHGVHRWMHGYHHRETMREWGHLQLCLTDTIERFAFAHPGLDPVGLARARRLLTEFFVECTVESAAHHVTLQETEAATRLQDLERVLENVRDMERQRAELWREAAHDLRGNIGVVKVAASVLTRGYDVPQQTEAIRLVQRGAESLTHLLNDLISLARLEAGRERCDIERFDAAELVRDICATLQPLASERRLFLKVEAPESLELVGDAVKTRRIAQNLLLNALKYTETGGVQVGCQAVVVGAVPSFRLTVQDTGVGFAEGPPTPLAEALNDATREAHSLGTEGKAPPPTLPSRSHYKTLQSGEGVGLAIVKRLCELLHATIELESEPGTGTTVRVTFPREFPAGAQ